MSEEEKNAIYEFKKELRLSTNIDDITTEIRNEYAEIILNLIDKQQKEIEELKNVKIMREYLENKFIPKDKIREKIKDLEMIIEYDKPTYIETLKYTIEILQELLGE